MVGAGKKKKGGKKAFAAVDIYAMPTDTTRIKLLYK